MEHSNLISLGVSSHHRSAFFIADDKSNVPLSSASFMDEFCKFVLMRNRQWEGEKDDEKRRK